MKKLPFCSIIVLNYNGKELLKDCFSSLRRINYPKERYEVIMVDNGSEDNSIEYVKKNFPWVKILALDKNYGFAEGNNKGINVAKGEYIVFLNNDTKVDKNWLIELVKVASSDEKIGIVGSKVLNFYNPKIIEYAGGYLDILGSPFHRGLNEIDKGQYDRIEEVFYVLGSSLLIKRNVLKKLKYCFDPSYFLYFEETDLCWRVKLLGYKVVYVPSSIVFHKGGVTASKLKEKAIYYLYKNKILSFKKNLRAPLRQLILLLVVLRMFLTIIYRMLKREWKYGIYVFKYLFSSVSTDINLQRIPLKKQLSVLSPPILSKYSQYFSGLKKKNLI